MASRKDARDHGIPMRTCVGCREKHPGKDMLRISCVGERLYLSRDRKEEGRGAYLCLNPECVKIAFRKNALRRAFRRNLPNEELARIEQEIEEIINK